MKIRRLIFGLTIVVASLIALMLWLGKKQPTKTPVDLVKMNTPLPITAKSSGTNTRVHTSTFSSQTVSNKSFPTPLSENKKQQMGEGLAKLNDEDIFLHAQVVDQFGSPVAGATVSGTIQVNNGIRVGTDRMSTITDERGLFTISGYKGKNLGVHVTKSGYVMVATNTSFIYSYLWPESQRYVPDPNNPTIIKMWKLQGIEPLVGISKEYKLPFTDAPTYFDLVAGKVVPNGGDLKITVYRPDGIISQQHPQNWSIGFDVMNGGFIKTSSRESAITFSAPESGYQPNGTFGNNNGPDVIDQAFLSRVEAAKFIAKFTFGFVLTIFQMILCM